jgi:hypothetical protein
MRIFRDPQVIGQAFSGTNHIGPGAAKPQPNSITIRLRYRLRRDRQNTLNTQKKNDHETHPSTSSGQANHTKKTIVNFLLRKNLTIDFVKNVQKNKNITDSITEKRI